MLLITALFCCDFSSSEGMNWEELTSLLCPCTPQGVPHGTRGLSTFVLIPTWCEWWGDSAVGKSCWATMRTIGAGLTVCVAKSRQRRSERCYLSFILFVSSALTHGQMIFLLMSSLLPLISREML